MPGFGSNPFGADPFGDWDWGKHVFFESIPEIYRSTDEANGSPHEKWAATQAVSFTDLRRKIRDFGLLRDPRRVRTEFDQEEVLVLGRQIVPQGPVQQRGVRGTVTGVRVFTGDRAHFTFADLGKQLTINGSTNPLNNRSVTIANVVTATQVVTDPPLALDAGPLRWELRDKPDPNPTSITIEISRGNIQNVAPGWLVSDGFAQFTVLSRDQFKESSDERKLLTLRDGTDGVIDAFGRFSSATAAFVSADEGLKIVLKGSSAFENEGLFEIVTVVNSTTAILSSTSLVTDLTPFFWSIRRRAEIVLQGPAVPTGIAEQSGNSAVVPTTPGTFEVPSGQFTQRDVGKLMTIRAPSNVNNGTYEITAVNTSTNVTLSVAVPVSATLYYWEVRKQTNYGDETQVLSRAPSLLQFLAQDFGIVADTRESEEFQRRYVDSVSRWIGLKGTTKGYEFLGELTGYEVTALHLYRVTQEIYLASDPASRYDVGEEAAGRFGSDGSLTAGTGAVDFSAPTAVFVATDVGRSIEISGSGSGNDGLRTIAAVLSPTSVQFRSIDGATVPDASNGSLEWRIVRLYSKFAPLLPVYDEVDTDIAREENPSWTPDTYCWESNGSITASVTITSVSPAGPSPFPVAYSIVGDGPWDIVTGLGVGKWRLTDGAAVNYFLESIPSEAPETGAGRQGTDGSLTLVGPDTRLTAPTAVFVPADVGRRVRISNSISGNNKLLKITAFISGTQVTVETGPIVPDGNNGTLGWAITRFTASVTATAPPTTGASLLQYICPVQFDCSYCGSNKVLIQGTTALVLENGFDRLFERLDQARPAHVEFVKAVGVTTTARVRLSATVTTP